MKSYLKVSNTAQQKCWELDGETQEVMGLVMEVSVCEDPLLCPERSPLPREGDRCCQDHQHQRQDAV